MYDIYKEGLCRSPICSFAGEISGPFRIADTEIKYINCQRDNADLKNHFQSTLKDGDQWCRQDVNFRLCLFAPENNGAIIKKYDEN